MQTFTDTLRYRFILANLVSKEFKTLYRSMALGLFWAVLQPLVLVTVLTVVWVVFFHQPTNFASKVLVCLIPYNLFSYCVSGCSGVILRNRSLVKKVRFPRQILPFSVVVTHVIHLLIQLPLLVAVLVLFPPPGDILGSHLLWLPLILLIQVGLVVGAGLLVSALNVVYRDVQYIVDSMLTIVFWASPILYTAQDTLLAPEARRPWLAVVYYCNPMAGILEGYRSVLYYGQAPHFGTLTAALGVTLLVGIIAVRTFWIHEREFADLV